MNFYFGRCLRIFKHSKEQETKEEVKENWEKKEKIRSKKDIEEEPKIK